MVPAYHAVLAVKDEREDALAACGGLAILDGCARRDPEESGNPAQKDPEDYDHECHFNFSVVCVAR